MNRRIFIAFCFLVVVILPVHVVSQNQGYKSLLTVAWDGSGDFRSLQEAISSVRAYSPEPVVIKVKNGIYKEKVIVYAWITNLTIVGESRDSTIITFDDYSGRFMASGQDTLTDKRKFSTFTSYTLWVQGNDVTLENLTIRNTAGRVGQAVALHVDGDRFVIRHCNLLGNQDTLLTANDSSRQYYFDCLIAGTTDFIFGPATAVFQRCTLRSLSNSYITAASTPKWKAFGYVFLQCTLDAAPEADKVYLGRPWRAYARTVFLQCKLGKHIRPEGWDNWRNPENEKTAYYAEYANEGEGAAIAQRVAWAHQLTREEASRYTLKMIFNGWEPALK